MRRWRAFVRAYRGAHRGRTVGFRGSRLVGAQERAPRGRSGGCAGARGAARGVACGSDHSRGGCGRGVLRGVCRRGGRGSLVLVADAAALSGSTRATTLVVMLVWLFFALIWDPNTASMPALQRGLPLLVLLAVGACAWHALGSPERVWRKLGGAR